MDDTISRKAAIEAFDGVKVDEENCTEYDIGYNDGIDFAVSRLSVLPAVQPEQRWIPCSERLPEHGGRYLISVLDGINRRTTVASYLPRCKAWTMTGRMAYWKVIAWKPLPEPYKGGKHETN